MVSEQFEWALLALAQPAKVQLGLFPDFANAADELALSWEEALEDTDLDELSDNSRNAIKELDDYMLSISGQEYAELWTNESVSSSVQWAKMRKMASRVIKEFGWIKSSPHKPSWAIYVHDDEST